MTEEISTLFPAGDLPARSQIFDNVAAGAAREEAIERAKIGAGDWIRRAIILIRVIPPGDEFTTDRIWECLGEDVPNEPRAMGAVTARAKADKLIEATGRYTKSVRVSCHARPILIWRRRFV